MSNKMLLLGDVSRLMGIPAHRIAYVISSGKIPEPELRINNHRVFQPKDIERLRDHFKSQQEENVSRTTRK